MTSDPGAYRAVSKKRQFAAGRALVERVPIHDQDVVLDAACGPGALCFHIAGRYRTSVVVGLDKSREMVRAAAVQRDRLASAAPAADQNTTDPRPGTTVFVEGDATKLPFPLESIDVLLCTSSLHWFWPDQESFLAEAFRVLDPGGYLGIEWFTRRRTSDENLVDTMVARALARLRPRPTASNPQPFGPRFMTSGALRQRVVRAGFRVLSPEAFPIEVSYPDGASAVSHWSASFGDALYGWLPKEAQSRFLLALEAEIDADRGTAHFRMPGQRVFLVAQRPPSGTGA